MIRGAIELVTTDVVQGWIYAEGISTRNRNILAFLNGQCIGAGTVGLFRQDLAAAGLGDGYFGFAIDVSVDEALLPSIVVKLEGSDALLIQANTKIAGAAATLAQFDRAAVTEKMNSLKWALKHARMAQSDYDFLRILTNMGSYERVLVHRSADGELLITDSPTNIATELLESCAGRELGLSEVSACTLKDLNMHIKQVANSANFLPIVAVYAKKNAVIRVVDGSHIAENQEGGRVHVTEYVLTPENVIILDARITLDTSVASTAAFEVNIISGSLRS